MNNTVMFSNNYDNNQVRTRTTSQVFNKHTLVTINDVTTATEIRTFRALINIFLLNLIVARRSRSRSFLAVIIIVVVIQIQLTGLVHLVYNARHLI